MFINHCKNNGLLNPVFINHCKNNGCWNPVFINHCKNHGFWNPVFGNHCKNNGFWSPVFENHCKNNGFCTLGTRGTLGTQAATKRCDPYFEPQTWIPGELLLRRSKNPYLGWSLSLGNIYTYYHTLFKRLISEPINWIRVDTSSWFLAERELSFRKWPS